MILKKFLIFLFLQISLTGLYEDQSYLSKAEAYPYFLFVKVSTMKKRDDGKGNNLGHPLWGSLNQTLSRIAPSAFEDGKARPSGQDRPSPRLISNKVCAQGNQPFENDPHKLSALFLVWGQFFTHDIHSTPNQEQEKQEFPIDVPKGDFFFDPKGQGNKKMPFVRSVFDKKRSENKPRQQINLLTSWFDGQLIYNNSLRGKEKGKLKLTEENLLTKNEKGVFVSGDKRVNENIVLTSLNTLFVRQHNRICERMSRLYPQMSDQEIFTYGKNYVSALIAKITYDDYLPLLLSEKHNLGRYRGYEPETNPSVSNIFSTSAFRFGHFTAPENVLKMNNNGKILQKIKVRDGVRNPSLIKKGSDIGQILKGQANNVIKKRTIKMVDELRNFLVSGPDKRQILLDLASLNIQRGRDHGLPDYNTFRKYIGLKQYTSFWQINSDPDTAKRLEDCYKDINLIDPFIGIVAEESLPGASIGQLGAAITRDTMHRIRAGDRFWYQLIFPYDTISEIKKTTLADIIKRNTYIQNIQDNVFIVP